MRCKVRVLKFGTKASDGSLIGESVVRSYLETPECIEDLKAHRMIGSLTHRVRNISALGYSSETASNLKKTIAKDDGLLLIDSNCPPTHYVDKLWIENGALWAELQIFDEEGFDDQAVQAIRRLKSLLKCTQIGISSVILGFWSGMKDGVDVLEKLVRCKGIDFTLSPSFPGSYVTDVMNDDGTVIEKTYSIPQEEMFEGYRVKTFSSLEGFDINVPKTSKIENKFTILKAKEFNSITDLSTVNDECEPKQKEFTVASVNDQIRMTKLSPRIRFRRIILEYRQVLKQHGGIEKIDEETLRIMKSLFANEILKLLQEATPQVMKGKQLNALLGLVPKSERLVTL